MRVLIFKPDGIGDFVLATGAIRLLEQEAGVSRLVLCVKSILVPLARDQFPGAEILPLPTAAERRVINLFVWNFAVTQPLWWRLRTGRFDTALCLRSMRNYLETFLFFSAGSRRHIACENLLLRSGRKVRAAVEHVVRRLVKPEWVPYPASGPLPLEIEAHRAVVTRLLGRPVTDAEILPTLRFASPLPGDHWVCAPVTNLASKVYPFPRWREVMGLLRPEAGDRKLLLIGVPADRPLLEELRDGLHQDGCARAEIHLPADLAALVRVIAGAGLVLSVDTAAAHFAAALDRPLAVAFSGLHQGMFAPWRRSARQEWVLPDPQDSGKKRKWHARLSPDKLAAAARRALAAHKSCS